MKQKTIVTGKCEMLVVDLPESATGIHIETDLICFDFKEDGITYPDYIIANGNWQHLGKATELTEEDWKGIVDQSLHTQLFAHYAEGVTPPNVYAYKTSTESGLSLLKANGVVLENPYGKERPKINLSRDDYDEFGFVIGDGILKGKEWEEKYWDWLESEKRVWRNCYLFIKQKQQE